MKLLRIFAFSCTYTKLNKESDLKQNTKIRIKDIAELAQVSAGTVDRVLHNRGEVKEETRKKILDIVEDLGYTPNIIAKSLASKKVYKICVLLPEAKGENPYWQKPLTGIDLAREELKYFSTDIQTFTYGIDSTSDFEACFEEILKLEPDGVIFTPHFIEASHKYVKICKELSIPVLFIDSNLEGEDVLGYFGQDAVSSGHLAAALMRYGLKEGEVVLILKLTKNRATSFHLAKREQGFLDAVKKNKDFPINTISFEIDITKEDELRQTLVDVFNKQKNIGGIFVTNSRVHKAAKVLCELNKSNLLLVGYDLVRENINYLKDGVIDFLICQKPEDQGYKSVTSLFNYILSNKKIERVNYSPIDIVIKENLNFYIKID